MNRNELREMRERSFEILRNTRPIQEVHRFFIRMTSGTTGRPIVFIHKPNELAFSMLNDTERLVAVLGSMNTRLFNALMARHQIGGGVKRIVLPDARDLTAEVGGLLADLGPDAIRGVPSLVCKLLRILPRRTKDEIGSVYLVGEPLTEENRDFLRSEVPRATISMSYVAAETGQLSRKSCEFLKPNQYHPYTGVTVGIEDPDETGAGKILVSFMTADGEQVERYQIGDTGRFLPPCRCGEKVTFELLGRDGYDHVKLAGALLVREEFDRAIRRFPYVIDYRVKCYEAGGVGTIELTCYTGGITKKLQDEFADRFPYELFVSQTKTLVELIEGGIIAPLRVAFVSEPFPIEHKELKILRIA